MFRSISRPSDSLVKSKWGEPTVCAGQYCEYFLLQHTIIALDQEFVTVIRWDLIIEKKFGMMKQSFLLLFLLFPFKKFSRGRRKPSKQLAEVWFYLTGGSPLRKLSNSQYVLCFLIGICCDSI